MPVRPETTAICKELRIDPLGLIGSGALLVAAPDSARTLAAIRGAGILAMQIGEFLPHDRWVRRDGRDLPLAPPAVDELWRALSAGTP